MQFKKELEKILKKELKKEIDLAIPPDSNLGDFSLPCFPYSKNPVELANKLKDKIKANFLEKTETKGPYLNFFIDKTKMAKEVLDVALKEKYQKSKGEKVMVEFSQANTHKAFHVGHIRGTSLGESLARILEFNGKKVVRVNYQGDTGMHIARWIWCYQKFHKGPLKKDENWIAKIYVDAMKRLRENEKLQEEVDIINRKLDSREDKQLNELWEKTRKMSLDALETIYKELNARFDHYFFESNAEKRAKELVKNLVKKKIAKISDGATIIDLKKYNLGVSVLLRKDGTILYNAKDLALTEEKFSKYKIETSIYVVGKDHEHYFSQLFKTLELMKFKQAKKCTYVPVSMVRLPWGKMSSRTGDNILYAEFKNELVNEAKKEIKKRFKLNKKELEKRSLAIAISSMKYTMLKQNPNKEIIFNKEEAIKFEGDTGSYLLYSYARASSIIRKANKKGKLSIKNLHEKEIELIKNIDSFQVKAREAGSNLNPGILANYSFKLAQSFNEFYTSCQVIGSEQEDFRLQLVEAFRITLRNALNLLGINIIERM